MTFYSDMADVASELLAEFGSQVLVWHPINTVNGPAGTVNNYRPRETSANCVMTAINDRNAPGAIIQQGDKLAILDGEVLNGDTIIVDPGKSTEEKWQVVEVNEIKPATESVVWKAQVRL